MNKPSPLPLSLAEIVKNFSPTLFTEVITPESASSKVAKVERISAIETAGPGDLVFVDKKEYLDRVEKQRPAAVILSSKLKADAPLHRWIELEIATVLSPNVPLAHALVKQTFADRDFTQTGWIGHHPSAVIHESARIGENTVIEPHVVIGARSRIGENCRIMAGTVIENDVVVGSRTIIKPKTVIGYGCEVGSDVIIEAGTVIGSEGFGFSQDAERKSYRIPQTGRVVIEDRVRIGAGNCIDRAAYAETRIGAGTKTDNLCHIAHNVQIGQDCLLTAMLCVAGSSKIGNRVITSGQTGIIDHITICDDAVLLHRAGVTKDIEAPGAYAGLPLQPLGDYLKNQAVLKSAVELKKRVAALESK